MRANQTKAVPDGLICFLLPLNSIATLVNSCRKSKNPALFLFTSGARNHLFRLEALCRIYRKIGSKKVFDPLYEEFKYAEDLLGKIDYYDSFYKEFSSEKKIPVSFTGYFSAQREKELTVFNDYIRSGTLFTGESRIQEIRDILTGVNWMERAHERKAIALFMAEQIERFLEQYRDGELNFHDMESGVHEFRRKLRWISIYSQCLNGLIQLKKTKLSHPDLQFYLEREIIESPYNKMPAPAKGIKPIYIRAYYFYALSWLIQETGRLKDAGLKIQAIHEGIKASGLRKKETVIALKRKLLPDEFTTFDEISETVEKLADDFIYRHRVPDLIRRDLMRSIQV